MLLIKVYGRLQNVDTECVSKMMVVGKQCGWHDVTSVWFNPLNDAG